MDLYCDRCGTGAEFSPLEKCFDEEGKFYCEACHKGCPCLEAKTEATQ